MKFQTKIEKLGIADEVNSIIENYDCGEINGARIIQLSKLRKADIQEEIGNFLNVHKYGRDFCCEGKHMKTFCKAFDIKEDELADYYAQAICEWGYEVAYAITEDIVLILE